MKAAALAVVVSLVVIVVVYIVTMYELYKKQYWIFAPHVHTVPSNACQPLINVTALTPDEKATRDALLKGALQQL